ncbi:MAG: hypothetical protein GX556_00760 [Fibrobacter sp.]|nr:hypothetical protein [Fibrobacter sp.]
MREHREKTKSAILLICFSALVFSCTQNPLAVFYDPPVVFTGYINGHYDSLAGNAVWKNRCTAVGDTLRIFIYSNDFSVSHNIWTGDFMRFDIYPQAAHNDNNTLLENDRILFHMARYTSGNSSYTIKNNDPVSKVKMTIDEFNPASGAELEIYDVVLSAPPVFGGQNLEIFDARITGVIE